MPTNIYGYKYKRGNRGEGYIPPTLSEKDEYIPETHIGMYSLVRNEKNMSVYMGESQCQTVRKKTFDSVLKIFREYGSPSYSDLWNYNIAAINDNGLNYFTTNMHIAPIAHLIQCFETKIDGKTYGSKHLMISFGINKKALNYYLKSVSDGRPKIPHLKEPPPKTRESVLFGYDTIKVGKDGKLILERNAVYNRFEHWCMLQGVTLEEGAMMALQTLIKDYPIDELNDLNYYGIVTELDRQIFEKQIEEEKETRTISFSKMFLNKAREIITRYNRDPNNIEKGRIDIDTYMNNALYLINNNMPVKYRDPELADDIENTKKMEEQLK